MPLLGLSGAVSQGVPLSLLHVSTERLQTLSNTAVRSSKPKHQPATGKHLPQETHEISIPSASFPKARADEKIHILLGGTLLTSAVHQHLCNYCCQSQENTQLCFWVFITYAELTL